METPSVRCPARSPGGVTKDGTLPRGLQCGLPQGHVGEHTLLIPTGAPWFPVAARPRTDDGK